MKALILENRIVDVVENEFDVAPQMSWIDCPDDCKAGWDLIDGVPTDPGPQTYTWDHNRHRAYNSLNQFEMMYNDQINGTTTWKDAIEAIKAKYPKPE